MNSLNIFFAEISEFRQIVEPILNIGVQAVTIDMLTHGFGGELGGGWHIVDKGL